MEREVSSNQKYGFPMSDIKAQRYNLLLEGVPEYQEFER